MEQPCCSTVTSTKDVVDDSSYDSNATDTNSANYLSDDQAIQKIENCKVKDKSCAICGQISHGFHFGVLACRACAAFFRRTVVEKKHYKCQEKEQCATQKDVQLNRDPIGRRKKILMKPKLIKEVRSSSSLSSSSLLRSTNKSDIVMKKQRTESLGLVSSAEATTSMQCSTMTTAPSIFISPETIKSCMQSSNESLSSTCTFSTQVSFMPIPLPIINCPTESHFDGLRNTILVRMHEGYMNFQSSQKSLHTVMYPDNIFSSETYRLVNLVEYVKMERGCLSLMYSMINDWYSPFDSLSHDLKVSALRLFSGRFTHLDQCYRTMLTFPDKTDSRYVLHYGQYMDANNISYFFAEEKDREMMSRMAIEIIKIGRRVVERMQQIKIRKLEVSALAGILLWNDVASLNVLPNTDDIINQIYSELHQNMIVTYGVMGTGARFGFLLGIIHDINAIEKDISESVTIRRILYPHSLDVWDDL